MIFVSFGNSPKLFTRLARAVDNLAEIWNEEIIVQNGFTQYPFKHCKNIPFIEQSDYKTYLKNSSVAILQGGWGGISEASDLGCRIVVVPRKNGEEHYHDQEQLIRKLEEKGICLGCYDTHTLPSIIEKARTYEFKPLQRGSADSIINQFIESI